MSILPAPAASSSAAPSLANQPGQPAEEPAKVASIGCVRQAAAPNATTAIVPQLVCRAKACPGTYRRKKP